MTNLADKKSHPLDRPDAGHGFDTSRVHAKGIFFFIVCFALTMAGILIGIWYFEGGVLGRHRPTDTAHPQSTKVLPQPLQPSPGHPTFDWQDLAALRDAQEKQLNSTGPNHIPIDQAMNQLLNSGKLNQPWKNPTTQPYIRPPTEPQAPPVENRT
jgi:hypothetical protein